VRATLGRDIEINDHFSPGPTDLLNLSSEQLSAWASSTVQGTETEGLAEGGGEVCALGRLNFTHK
jgi:hypothetical protein